MSGSSLDGLDIACCHFTVSSDHGGIHAWEIADAETLPYSSEWASRLYHLPAAAARDYARTHTYFGHYMGELVRDFLTRHPVSPDYIASHGHTVFHEPERGMTAQIGCGASLAAATGIPVVCDFRTSDVARSGQGAPLAPIADQYLLDGYDMYLNLGGIANLSFRHSGRFFAFDVCVANQLLNALAQLTGEEMDTNGAMAATGRLQEDLLRQSLEDPYLSKPFPKSLGNPYVREHFLPVFLGRDFSPADLLRTACEHIALQTGRDAALLLRQFGRPSQQMRLLATGGGAFNVFLIDCLRRHLSPLGIEVIVPSPLIVKYKESALMALLGLLRILHRPNALKTVTGATAESSGGCIYL